MELAWLKTHELKAASLKLNIQPMDQIQFDIAFIQRKIILITVGYINIYTRVKKIWKSCYNKGPRQPSMSKASSNKEFNNNIYIDRT